MKQRAEIIHGGSRVRMEQEQTEFALSRDEVIFLTQVPTHYLLDEMRARGLYFTATEEERRKGSVSIEVLIDELVDRLCVERGVSAQEILSLVVFRTMHRFGGRQMDVAKILNVSRRVVHYYVADTPSGRRALTRKRKALLQSQVEDDDHAGEEEG